MAENVEGEHNYNSKVKMTSRATPVYPTTKTPANQANSQEPNSKQHDARGFRCGSRRPTLIKLELHGLTAIKLPCASVRKATKIVPTGWFGRVKACPTVFVPVQFPITRAEALKLPAVNPVAPCSC